MSRSSYFRGRRRIAQGLVELAEESCREVAAMTPDDSVLSTDTAWSQCRNAGQSTGVVIVQCKDRTNPVHGKAAAFHVCSRIFAGHVGNFAGSSQAMEATHHEALLLQFGGDPRIRGIVHDQDAKLKKTMERMGVQMQLMIDENT
jgi:hypothetical protein